ncbi:MAG: histidine phosphatase family protein [Anaerolineae bacterium]
MKLYFVRHGQSKANLLGIISNRGKSYGPTDLGRQQAHTLAESLAGVGVTHIYTSPLLRAEQTASILSETLAVPYQISAPLCEFDCGVLENKSDEISWQMNREMFETWMRGEDWDKGLEQGESLEDIRRRFVPFIHGLLRDLPSESVVVLVGHGGTYRCMLPFVLSNIDISFTAAHGLNNSAMVVAETSPAGLICLSWGDSVFPAGK